MVVTIADKMLEDTLLEETHEKREKKEWSLLAAWGGNENCGKNGGTVDPETRLLKLKGKRQCAVAPAPYESPISLQSCHDVDVDERDGDDEATTVKSDATRRTSGGSLLRLQSVATQPSPHPLSDLMRLTAAKHLISMNNVIHSMASLSRAGKEKGMKKVNQDSCFAFRQFVQPHQAIGGVFDGHGPQGHKVSRYIKSQLPTSIAEQLKTKGEVAIHAVLRSAFIETHEALRYAPDSINARLSGSTAVVTLLQGKRITTAWVGDSRAVIVRREVNGVWRGIPLTCDHKPILAGEMSRIVASGGRVERLTDEIGRQIGPHRVWLPGAWVPGLAMSRAMGDFVAQSIGVIPDPEIISHDLDDGDEFLIVASDGVWEFMKIQELVDIVSRAASAEEACRLVVHEATARWNKVNEGVTDDITVVATKFLSRVEK